ncbi:hypothetical protein HDV05_004906 [Chytridiales sp. JEL 0842]|nr:hypothetical protein HDV05_004906 [Chytridiales sp. JEL 0842]
MKYSAFIVFTILPAALAVSPTNPPSPGQCSTNQDCEKFSSRAVCISSFCRAPEGATCMGWPANIYCQEPFICKSPKFDPSVPDKSAFGTCERPIQPTICSTKLDCKSKDTENAECVEGVCQAGQGDRCLSIPSGYPCQNGLKCLFPADVGSSFGGFCFPQNIQSQRR